MYDVLEAFAVAMDGLSPSIAGVFLLSLVALPLLTLVHEAGHALAVRARGLPLQEMVVGDTPDLTILAGSFRFRFGRRTSGSSLAGYVRFDGTRATPSDVLIISLAGPLAELLVAPLAIFLALAEWTHGLVQEMLWFVAAMSLLAALVNLFPDESDGIPNDGLSARMAWAAMQAPHESPTEWVDPHAATSVPPPGS